MECDAAIMDGPSGDFGSVGAVSGISIHTLQHALTSMTSMVLIGVKNPIRLAYSILKHSRIPDSLGRIPPLSVSFVLCPCVSNHLR